MSGFGGAKNPFFDPDEEVEDDTFINYRREGYNTAEDRHYQEKRDQLLEQRRQVENRMLQSSKSAVRTLYEAEEVGMSAAEELVRQGEQLKKVDRNLDEINATMKTTQKHLTSMKSVFSGIKSYFGRSNTVDSAKGASSITSPSGDGSDSALAKTLDQVRGAADTARQNNHPALRARGLADTSGFGAGFDDDDSPSAAPNRSTMVEKQLDQDLSELSNGLGRLKNLAQGLGSELDDQMDLLHKINENTDKADGTIQFQNKQMNRLLKK